MLFAASSTLPLETDIEKVVFRSGSPTGTLTPPKKPEAPRANIANLGNLQNKDDSHFTPVEDAD